MLDRATRDRLLRRIGLETVPAADVAGLYQAHRAFVSTVPYEDLAVQLGESRRLEADGLVARVLSGGRGGYCFEANTVLRELLEALGFEVERRLGIVGSRRAWEEGEPINHMVLVVTVPDGGQFIADSGLGEGPLDPLPLIDGRARSGSFEYALEREGRSWWVAQHEFGSFEGFRFADRPVSLNAFQPHHLRLSRAPDSSFVNTLVVQRPADDQILTLRARTLFVDGPGSRDRVVLGSRDQLASALQERFGIDPDALGPERIARLWAQAAAQHARHEQAAVAKGE